MAAYPDWLAGLAQELAAANAGDFWFWTGAALLASVGGFVVAFASLHKARLIENTPTSLIRSAAQGYIELDGFARLLPGPEIHSPLSGARCCWWRYRIEQKETTSRNGRRTTRWRTIESGTSDALFLIADATGECVIDPEGAEVDPSLTRQWRGTTRRPQQIPGKSTWLQFGDYRYKEELLGVGDPLYALGWFRSQSGHHDFNEDAEVGDLLRTWKADQRALLARFDANRDQTIDLQEWGAVRRAALAEVRAAHLQRSVDPDVHVLSRPADGRPFLLSTLGEDKLTAGHRFITISALVFSFVSGICGVFALTARGIL